jgi:acetyltransferase-like isoleucine patch superfamily enzyme
LRECRGNGRPATIGDRTDIQPNTRINATVEVRIGGDCAILSNFDILDSDFFRLSEQLVLQHCMRRPCGSETACGSEQGVDVLKGIEIGSDRVIAAGARVIKPFAPNSLVGGVPVRRLAGVAMRR